MARPRLIPGGVQSDDRGSVVFVNDFDFSGVDRFYAIRARRAGVPRGWVGHRRDQKWFFASEGEVLLAVVEPDDWDTPSQSLPVEVFRLSAEEPEILHIPAGFATAMIHRSPASCMLVFSSGSIESARSDDYRFPVDHWPIPDPSGD